MAQSPSSSRAFVTLLTTDSYLAGALTTINSLLDLELGVTSTSSTSRKSNFETVCLVTPSTVGQSSIKALQKVFDHVIGVEEITTRSWHELELLGRKDLSASLTKLHLWRLTQYKKVIFLDADTLVLKPLSHLFDQLDESVDFAAAPDSGWPDSFNSGVMFATPSQETFNSLIEMMDEKGTWDGGDQGLLNDYFQNNWYRLKYTYNVTPSAYYTYAPAFRRHGHDVSVLHFIGKSKPWKRGVRGTYVVEDSMKDYYNLVGLWYDVYERHYGRSLTHDVASKVVAAPSFQSSFTSLEPHQPSSKHQSAVVTSATSSISSRKGTDSPPRMEWDPAHDPPPKNDYQMREAITARYDSVWDDPSTRRQKIRFQPPSSYPNVPASTHEWYKDVMTKKPDPSAVKPVFPWEEPKKSSRPSQPPSPVKAPSRIFPPSPTKSPSDSESGPIDFTPRQTYTNAWDSIPGINRYAKSLAKATKQQRRKSSVDASKAAAQGGNPFSDPSSSSSTSSGAASSAGLGLSSTVISPSKSDQGFNISNSDGLGGRKSSLKEPKPYRDRSDASSRDGDDEDEDDETTSSGDDEDKDVDRPRIAYRRRTSSQGSTESRTSRSSQAGSPVKGRSRSGSQESGGESSGSGAPSSLTSLTSAMSLGGNGGATSPPRTRRPMPPPPVRRTSEAGNSSSQQHHQPAHHTSAPSKSFMRSPPGSGSNSASGSGSLSPALPTSHSPRLAAQAIRNSTAARMTSAGSGNGDGPPLVRATRVFSPETDTGVVKQQGLAALQRFVENFEAQKNEAGNNGNGEGSNFGTSTSGASTGGGSMIPGSGSNNNGRLSSTSSAGRGDAPPFNYKYYHW